MSYALERLDANGSILAGHSGTDANDRSDDRSKDRNSIKGHLSRKERSTY